MFEKYSNIKFYGNQSLGGRVVPCGRTDGQSDMTKLTVVLLNFATRLHIPLVNLNRTNQQTVHGSVHCSMNWCAETDSIQLTAVTGTDGLPQSQ